MSDEPETPEEVAEANELSKMYAAARSIVKFLRFLNFGPRDCVACLGTALAIVMRQSNTPFGPDQLKAVELTIQLELDHPMAEATPSPEQPHP